ncbi:MAG: phosphopyruvate hydratase [Candidatus Paceibacterota bacterium]
MGQKIDPFFIKFLKLCYYKKEMKITDVNIKIISDSRGKETLEAELKTADISVSASVPAGKSTGTHEAFVLEPKNALKKFEEIKSKVLGQDFNKQEDFDNFLISLDGTSNKQNLGGNLILALSLSWARLKAKNEGKELFQYINKELGTSNQEIGTPRPVFNVINGGVHATHPKSKLEFQEFQVIPSVEDFGIALSVGREFYRKLQTLLENKFGKENISLGDEAGFSAPFKNNEEAIEVLAELIDKHSYPLRIGLDIAASQFYKSGGFLRESGYVVDGKKHSVEELKDLYLKLIETYNILSIEDPFYEESFDSFASLTADSRGLDADRRGLLVITDDLTTTNPERLKTAINKKSGNAILIKLNQIGTLTETLKVVKLAYENNWQAIVSHRSGETMDDFIADLAVGINAWGIKAGAPAKPERLIKYERVLEIVDKK